MKRILACYIQILPIILIAQTSTQADKTTFGFSFAFSTENVLGMDFSWRKDFNRFHFGFGYQFNGQKNEVVKERKANYGLTKIEDGDFFWLIDFGYSRIIKEKLAINPEVSFGSKKYFTSYEDNRFKDNGYSLINRSLAKAGLGVNIGYLASEYFEFFIGYHTMKKMNFGLRINVNFNYTNYNY